MCVSMRANEHDLQAMAFTGCGRSVIILPETCC